jgi:hypothetical protein
MILASICLMSTMSNIVSINLEGGDFDLGHPHLAPRFGTLIWDPEWTPIWDPDLRPRFETPIWDPDFGPRFGTPIWDPDLGPPFWTLIWTSI